jgi:hypothetical protein
MLPAARVFGYLVALAAGAAAGLLGSFKYNYTYAWVPVGLLVALCLIGAVFVTSGLALRSRGAAALAAAGWVVAAMVMSMNGPGGDLVVPASGLGYSWLLAGFLVAVVSVGVPYAAIMTAPPRTAERADTPAEESSGRARSRR